MGNHVAVTSGTHNSSVRCLRGTMLWYVQYQKRNSDAGQLAVRLVMLKCHRGKAECLEWHINQETRRLISEFIHELLAEQATPTLIVGDIGMHTNYLLGDRRARNKSSLIYNLARHSQIVLSTHFQAGHNQ